MADFTLCSFGAAVKRCYTSFDTFSVSLLFLSWWVCSWSEWQPGGNGSAWSPASGWWRGSSAWASSSSWLPWWGCVVPWSTIRSCSSLYPLRFRGVFNLTAGNSCPSCPGRPKVTWSSSCLAPSVDREKRFKEDVASYLNSLLITTVFLT